MKNSEVSDRQPFLFIDFEASSLASSSFPIEVAWINEAGEGQSFLILPEPGWTDWSGESQVLHGITKQHLLSNGKPAASVAKMMHAACRNRRVVSDAPAYDQAWLTTLLRVDGHPAPRVRSVQKAYAETLRPLLDVGNGRDARGPEQALMLSVTQAMAMVQDSQKRDAMREKRSHRALDDAYSLWWVWNDLQENIRNGRFPS